MRAVYTFDVDTEEDRWNAFRQGEQSMAVIVGMLEWLRALDKMDAQITALDIREEMLVMIDRHELQL